MLNEFISAFRQFFGWYEVKVMTPVMITGFSTARPLSYIPNHWVLSYSIRVRDLGTATYIGIGDQFSQAYRLTHVSEIFGWSGNTREAIDLNKVWIVSDAADSELELYVLYKDNTEGVDIANFA